MEKRWSGKSIKATFKTQEGFEKVMTVPEFRWQWDIPVRKPISIVISIVNFAPEAIEEMETGLDRKTFYFEKFLNDERTEALYLAK